jgi:hypothetical protein
VKGSYVAGIVALLVAAAASACNVIASIAVSGADFGGATATAHCDRRFVADGGQRSAFCQELVDTVAASQFADDCTKKFAATPGTGLCPRAEIIAGCELDTTNEDGSHVWDWYYDVSAIVADAGELAGLDGGPTFADPVPEDVAAVSLVCADPTRDAGGAKLVFP